MRQTRIGRATLTALLLMASTGIVKAQYLYTTNSDNTITITRHDGSGGAETLPSIINGLPVTGIGCEAFYFCTNLTSITIPDSFTGIGDASFRFCTGLTNVIIGKGVASIGFEAFDSCTNLTSVYFKGNAPTINSSVFTNETPTIYYMSGTKGWGATFAGCPTKVWKP